MTPIRVLILISGLTVEGPNGGIARHAIELSRTLDPHVVQPIIGAFWDYHTPHDALWLERLRDEGAEVFVATDWDEQAQYQSCVRAWRETPKCLTEPVDIVHSHGEFSDLAAILLRRKLGAKAIVRTVHSEFEWSKRPLYGKLFPQLLYPLAFDRELGVSRQVVANLDGRPLAALRRRRAVLMRSAINLHRFENLSGDPVAKRLGFGIPATAPVIGSVGRLTWQKGYRVLIASFARVLARHPDARLLLVGVGPENDALRQLAVDRGMAERVIFAGSRTDVEELLTIMDVFASSSRFEGLPAVVLESMGSGTPVVATEISGTIEVVQHGVTGFLVPPEDEESLATAICAMLENPRQAKEMAATAGRMVRKEFSFEAAARRHEETYCQLMRMTSGG